MDYGSAALAVIVACAIGAAAVFSLSVGLFLGCIIHWHASVFYAKSADDAVARARDKAYADHLAKLDEEAKRQASLNKQELPQDRDEAEANFEQSLATLFPNDPKIQDALRKQRREKEALGG